MRPIWRQVLAAGIGLAAAACAPTPPPPAPATPSQAPGPAAPASPGAAKPNPPEPQSEQEWRRAVAQHILTVNRDRVFEGRPPSPLKAVIVLDLTIGSDGRLQKASVLRAPDHARELGAEAVRAAQAASPLPPPPRALLSRGVVRITETWLFRADNRFQLRTLAQTQRLE